MRNRSLGTLAATGVAVLAPLFALALTPQASSAIEPRAAESGLRASAPLTTATATATVTATSVVTATATPTRRFATPTRTATTAPKPAFLPVAVKDAPCSVRGGLDVVFVLDGSAYMKNLSQGQPAWEAGRRMIRTALTSMQFAAGGQGGHDQAGLVVFRNRPAIEEQMPLTGDANALLAYLNALEYGTPADTARMDAGMQVAMGQLGASTMPGNTRAIIFISEMQPKNVPYKREPGCEDADENCTMLKRAAEAKNAGILIAVWATGTDARGDELMAMASSPALAIELPSDPQMAATIAALAPRTPCSKDHFWPYGRRH